VKIVVVFPSLALNLLATFYGDFDFHTYTMNIFIFDNPGWIFEVEQTFMCKNIKALKFCEKLASTLCICN